MGQLLTALLLLVFGTPVALQAQAAPDWKERLAARRQQLIDANGPGTDAALRTDLLTLRDQDQVARGIKSSSGKDAADSSPKGLQIASNLLEIDSALTARLKTMVQAHGWPTIALVGFEASNAATLLLTHSRDRAWRQELLPQLAALADGGKIDGSALALMIDNQLIANGKPQRYGTQFKFVDGEMAMYAVEDPGGLDGLRARTLLPPIEVYKAQLEKIYHLKTTSRVVSSQATDPQ